HTSFSRDWSSDVCSSDLGAPLGTDLPGGQQPAAAAAPAGCLALAEWRPADPLAAVGPALAGPAGAKFERALRPAPARRGRAGARSEERRVGRGGWVGWSD